jgi:hypothetical protein
MSLESILKGWPQVGRHPYQTANAKITDRCYRSASFVKFTEDEIGAIMCALGAIRPDLLEELDQEAVQSAAQKVSVTADQRAAGVFGSFAMSNASRRGRLSGYWGLQQAMPDAYAFKDLE